MALWFYCFAIPLTSSSPDKKEKNFLNYLHSTLYDESFQNSVSQKYNKTVAVLVNHVPEERNSKTNHCNPFN